MQLKLEVSVPQRTNWASNPKPVPRPFRVSPAAQRTILPGRDVRSPRLRSPAHSLALSVIQYIAAQTSLFGGFDRTPEFRFEVIMKIAKCAVGQENCSRLRMRFH